LDARQYEAVKLQRNLAGRRHGLKHLHYHAAMRGGSGSSGTIAFS
jgi:hypothetical protein